MKDSDGNECDLATLCVREPGWAANRISALMAENADLRSVLTKAGNFENVGDGTAKCAACGFCALASAVHRMTREEYKRRVRALHCAACGCAPPCEANHVTHGRGVGQKASDFDTFPLCTQCHRDWTDHSGRFRNWSKARRRLWQWDMAGSVWNLLNTIEGSKRHGTHEQHRSASTSARQRRRS